MSKTIVITAHGKMDNINPIKLTKNLITTCKLGEVHSSKLVKFKNIN